MCDICSPQETELFHGRYYYIIQKTGTEPRLAIFEINNGISQFRVNENFYIPREEVEEGILIPTYQELSDQLNKPWKDGPL